MAFAGLKTPSNNSQAVKEALESIRARSYASLNPRTGAVQSVSGYFDSDLGKVMCQVLFSMSCRTQELYEGKSKGVAFHGINSRENSYKFDSIWMQDTLLLTHRSAQDHM